jgi:hypothetical protein
MSRQRYDILRVIRSRVSTVRGTQRFDGVRKNGQSCEKTNHVSHDGLSLQPSSDSSSSMLMDQQ